MIEGIEGPGLSDSQQRVVDSLRADGIAVARFAELFGESRWSELQADIEPFIAEQTEALAHVGDRPATKDEFIVRRFFSKDEDAPKPRFSLDSPWLATAVSETVLGIVNDYRQDLVQLYYLDNWFTVPYAGLEERVASQRWHRDPEEEHVVKVFLYFSDVDEGAGPFEYIKGSPAGNRYGHVRPWGKGSRHPKEHELAEIPVEERVLMTGPPGTMIFCDTGGFHRGGFARTHPRVLSIWSYVSPTAGKEPRYEVEHDGREAELPAQTLAALS